MSTHAGVRAEPALGRQLVWYFGGLLVTYAVALVVFWPPAGEQPSDAMVLAVMFAPTVGAVLVRVVTKRGVRWGRPNWWLLAALMPAVGALGAYLLGTVLGWTTWNPDVLRAALVAAPASIGLAALSAVGEEIGWRGFLWPTLRSRAGFWRVSLIVGVIWWVYHVPLILLGWYGNLAGLPAFTVAIAGFTLFVGVVTDRAKSLWPSVVAHGSWNGLVATNFAATLAVEQVPAFSGSEALLGEFGWLAAASSFLLGLAAALWHTRRITRDSAANGAPR